MGLRPAGFWRVASSARASVPCWSSVSARTLAAPGVVVTSLRIESIELPTASVGAASRLPPLRSTAEFLNPELDVAKAESVLGCSLVYGQVGSILPYTWQGSYDRVRSPRATTVAVLENDLLRAVFLLEAGGRLWSLTHRPSGRDLLYTNPVFQPANVGIKGRGSLAVSSGIWVLPGIAPSRPLRCTPRP